MTGVLFIALVFARVSGAGQHASNDQVRLLFTGDILLSRRVAAELDHRGRSPWLHLQKLLHDADWVAGNFEGAVGATSGCVGSKSPCFATRKDRVWLLKDAGFHAVTIENNHAGDVGSPGRKQTREAFREAGLLAVDFENSPQFVQFTKFKIALIAITTVPAADGRVQEVPSEGVLEKLRLAKSQAGLVVVSIHWGNELVPWASSDQRKQAAWLVENGADLVLGHHPHVIQAPQCIAGSPVFFSLGNHVFDQDNPKTKEGLIADCLVTGSRLQCRAIRTHTSPGTTAPRLAGLEDEANSNLAACSPAISKLVDSSTRASKTDGTP